MCLFSFDRVQCSDVLSYPSLLIPQYQTTFIQGESGCGKSTLLKLLNGTISPTRGTIRYKNNLIESYDPIQLRKEVLLVRQSFYLFDASIRENFDLFYEYRETTPLSEEKMKQLLALCCLDMPLNASCTTLSGGERQRVFLAICLSLQPQVLLLDEPTSALDHFTGNQVIQNIYTHCKKEKQTLVVVSHDPLLTKTYADYLIDLAPTPKRRVEK